jgi:hypothetical protein
MDDTQITSPATDDTDGNASTGPAATPGQDPGEAAAASDRANPERHNGDTSAQASTGEPSPLGETTADADAAEVQPATAQEGRAPTADETPPAGEAPPTGTPGFRERGRMRRRARFLRRARELAYRDLGGLVFDLHRFAQRNDALVLAKLDTIGRIDSELRVLESALAERQPATVLREAGITACPRCAAIHGSDDRFCPNCGLAMDPRAERPVAGPAAPMTPPPTASAPQATPSPPAVSSQSTVLAPAGGGPAPASAPAQAPTSASSAEPPGRSAPPASPQTQVPSAPSTPETPKMPETPPANPAQAAPAADGSASSPGKPGKTTPAGPAPTVDQPTEIIRPPARDNQDKQDK